MLHLFEFDIVFFYDTSFLKEISSAKRLRTSRVTRLKTCLQFLMLIYEGDIPSDSTVCDISSRPPNFYKKNNGKSLNSKSMHLITIISSYSLVSAYFEAGCKEAGDSCD